MTRTKSPEPAGKMLRFDDLVDAYINEAGNPAVKRGEDGSIGPNILVSFDGSISMWQSEMPDVNLSLDTHDYSDFESNVFSDPGVLATIE
mgnify:CR=1 FL=1